MQLPLYSTQRLFGLSLISKFLVESSYVASYSQITASQFLLASSSCILGALFSTSVLFVEVKYYKQLVICSCISTLLCQLCDGSWVHGRQCGQVTITSQLSMSIEIMEVEIVHVIVRFNQAVTQQFSRTSSGICSFEAWITTSRLDHCLLA